MAVIPLVIDCRVPYAADPQGGGTLLALPLGGRRLLDQLIGMVSGEEFFTRQTIVLCPPSATKEGRGSLLSQSSLNITLTSAEDLPRLLADVCEDSDHLLVIDPRWWPSSGYDGRDIARIIAEYRGATHAVCLDSTATRELIQHDREGRVRRIQRYYNQVQWPEIAQHALSFTVVGATAARDLVFGTLGELRRILADRGVLSRDYPLPGGAVDLTVEKSYLALQERWMADMAAEQKRSGLRVMSTDILVGRECQVDASARLVPPIILQEGVVIEAEAVIVGPAVIGAGSIIRKGAAVVQSVLRPDTVVAGGAVIRHRVAGGECRGALASGETPHEIVATEPQEMTADDEEDLVEELPATSSLPVAFRRRRAHEAVKRLMDIVIASATLVLLSPLMVIVAILIKLDSRGPVFFVHRRETRGGKEFPCLKFRTMVSGAHQQQRQLYRASEVDGPQFKIQKDPRVTRVGRWIRATNIDELPQLFNVLVGHMSLVGPRPSPFRENQICVPWRLARLSVRPGITGLWQVCRQNDRSRGDFHEWIYYDMTYVRQFSIWLDLKILAATLLTLGGRWSVPMSWLTRPVRPNYLGPPLTA